MKNNSLSNGIRLAVVLTLIICTLTPATLVFAQSQPEIYVLSDKNLDVVPNGEATPSTLDGTDFGNVPINTPFYGFSSFRICNDGIDNLNLTGALPVQLTGDASFSIELDPDTTIIPQDCTIVEIKFAPTTTGTKNATVSIANDDSDKNPYTFNITGNGVDPTPAEIDVKNTSHNVSIADGDTSPSTSDDTDFGDTSTDSPNSFTYNICNDGDLDLTLNGLPVVELTGDASFSITTQDPENIVAAHSRDCHTFQITFAPITTGAKTATVNIASDDADENPYTFDVTGNGVDPAPEMDVTDDANWLSIADGDTSPSVDDSTDFGDVETSSPRSLLYDICNNGTTNVSLTGTPLVQLTGDADFSVAQNPQDSIAANDCTSFQIEFAPTTTGAKTATVSIANNDADENPYTFAIAGNGILPAPAEIYIYGYTHQVTIASGDTTPSVSDDTDLGTQDVAANGMSYYICNSGNTTLHLTGTPLVQLTGSADFSVTTNPSSTIAATECTNFSIMFYPTSSGIKTTTISIANDDADENPYTFVIQGKPLDPDHYENDNAFASAKPISAGIPQTHHSIAPAGDVDYMTFTLSQESAVTLETSGPDDYADTVLDLYRSNQSLIAENDDLGISFYSRITRTCNTNALPAGTYYVKVKHPNDQQTILDYTLAFTKTPCPKTLTLSSIGTQDGFVLESTETSNKGGSINSTSKTFVVGDNAAKKQYRGILSFNTSSIPDNATITSVILKVKKYGIVGGGNPVSAFKGFMADIKNGSFGQTGLQVTDFQTAGTASYGPFVVTPVNNLYSINLTAGKFNINKLITNGGLTQIRLRFKLDDNNNAVANYLALFSGNTTVAADRPQLVIMYTVP